MENLNIKYKVGDYVGVQFRYAGRFGGAKVEAFTVNGKKVTYDLSVQVDKEQNHFTRINGIDQAFLMSREEWLEYNQDLRDAEKPNVIEGLPAHTSREFPYNSIGEGPVAKYVLIDINGWRKPEDFEIGFYNTTSREWSLKYSKREIDLENMKWMYLPEDKDVASK